MFLFQSLEAQISFTNRNDLLTNSDFHSGVAIAVADMNGDGLDDIVRMDQGHLLTLEYQTPNQMFTTMQTLDMAGGSQWSMCVADIDNNGFNEVLTGGAYDEIKLAIANADGTDYTLEFLPDANMFLQGSNFADINNDGHVDVFGCHDDAASRIWINDGAGNFTYDVSMVDLAVDGSTGENASGNYGSIWTDFDHDGDVDLYIAKCRQGVSSTTDERRINKLYVNDGNGNFTENAEEYGLRIGWQSWTADFQDVNNDGFLDCFITNHDHNAQLLINDGTGHFVEATNTGINVSGLPIQGVMRDFDNDGWVDIIVSGSTQHIFKNNGDLTFTEMTGIFDSNDMESYALGDLNNDGYVDIYAGYANIFTSPSNTDDVLWMNDGGTNNYLSVNLQGVISNRNALGAMIEIYGDWGIQIREVRSGESYGIMNSMTQYFGLGQATEVDSVVVNWPSGIRQTETGININSTLQLIEGGCLAAAPTLDVQGNTLFCTGESIVIEAPAGYATYEWSNGATTPSITVTTEGNFSVTVTDADGCFGFSTAVATTVDPVFFPQIEAVGDVLFCEGESVVLQETATPDALSYTWSNGMTGSAITITESGTYSVVVEGPCMNFISSTIDVDVIDAPAPTAIGDTIFAEGIAELVGFGNDLAWYDVETGGTALGFGPNFTTPVISATTDFYVEDRSGIPSTFAEGGMLEHSGTLYSGNQNSNNLLIFDAFEPVILDSVRVYTDVAGVREIICVDNSGNTLSSALVNIPEGESVVYVGLEIPEGTDLALTTDEITNNANLGFGGPRLQRSSEDVQYPYDIGGMVSLKESNFGDGWYYYFYDWKIRTPDFSCASPRVAVEALLDASLPTIDLAKTDDVKVFPNPSNGNITLELKFDITESVQLRLTDITGKTVIDNTVQDSLTDLHFEHLAKGVYMMQVIHGENIYSGKIVIQ